MKFDTKSAVIGLLLGIIIMLVAGAGNAGGEIGVAVPAGGQAVLKAVNGEAFIIDMKTAMAKRILFKKPEPADPRYPNNVNGRALVLSR